jgi:hypothetical protein
VLTLPFFILSITLPYGLSWFQIRPQMRFLLLATATAIVGIFLETYFTPHYAAPFTGLALLLVLSAMRNIRPWKPYGRNAGLFLVRAVPTICVLMFVLRCFASPLHIPMNQGYTPGWHERGPNSVGRKAVEDMLKQIPGPQLVIVHYSNQHSPFYEWVYNDADIDSSKIVWARGMGLLQDRELIHYFHDRQVWLLEPDARPQRLEPYFGDAPHALSAQESTK